MLVRNEEGKFFEIDEELVKGKEIELPAMNTSYEPEKAPGDSGSSLILASVAVLLCSCNSQLRKHQEEVSIAPRPTPSASPHVRTQQEEISKTPQPTPSASPHVQRHQKEKEEPRYWWYHWYHYWDSY